MWYKFTKTFRGGSNSYIKWLPDEDIQNNEDKKRILNNLCSDIGEITSGGHSYGWTVKSEECSPSIEEMTNLIKDLEQDIDFDEKSLLDKRKKLLFYYRELEKIEKKLEKEKT